MNTKEYYKLYYIKNQEKIKLRAKLFYEKNKNNPIYKNRRRKQHDEYYIRNKEKIKLQKLGINNNKEKFIKTKFIKTEYKNWKYFIDFS